MKRPDFVTLDKKEMHLGNLNFLHIVGSNSSCDILQLCRFPVLVCM